MNCKTTLLTCKLIKSKYISCTFKMGCQKLIYKPELSIHYSKPLMENRNICIGLYRYIYSEKGGWVDMAHFMFYAGKAYAYKMKREAAQKKIESLSGDPRSAQGIDVVTEEEAGMDPVGEAMQDGYAQEMSDKACAKHSAYSYEDLPSDKLGAEFGANYFDPNSKLTFGEQLKNYLDGLGATDPMKAPNYSSLPAAEPNEKPSRTNRTATPVYTKANP